MPSAPKVVGTIAAEACAAPYESTPNGPRPFHRAPLRGCPRRDGRRAGPCRRFDRSVADPDAHARAGARLRPRASTGAPSGARARRRRASGGDHSQRPVAADRRRHRADLRDDREQHDRDVRAARDGRHAPHRRHPGDRVRHLRPARVDARRRRVAPGGLRLRAHRGAARGRGRSDRRRPPTTPTRCGSTSTSASKRRTSPCWPRRPSSTRPTRPTRARSVHRDFAKRGVDSGLRSPIELTRAEADLARFDVGRVRARGGLAVARSVLAAAIGAPDPALDVAGDPRSAVDMPALAEALALAETRDPQPGARPRAARAAERGRAPSGRSCARTSALTATLSGRAGGAPPSSGRGGARRRLGPERPQLGRGARPVVAALRRDRRRARATRRARARRCAATRSTWRASSEVARGAPGVRRGRGRARRLSSPCRTRSSRRAPTTTQADARFRAGHRHRRRARRRRGGAHRRRDSARARPVRRRTCARRLRASHRGRPVSPMMMNRRRIVRAICPAPHRPRTVPLVIGGGVARGPRDRRRCSSCAPSRESTRSRSRRRPSP